MNCLCRAGGENPFLTAVNGLHCKRQNMAFVIHLIRLLMKDQSLLM